MFSAIESPAQPPSGRKRHRPSIGRIFYWSYLLGVPLVAVSVGVALLIASNQLDAAVQSYRNAPPCPAPTATACYTLAPGTLVKFTITHGKTGDTADMTVQLPDGTRSTWAKTNGQEEDALHVAAPIRAEFYQGTITAVYLGAIGIQTKDSPVYKQSDMRLGALLIPTLGLIIAAVSFFTLRGQRQLAVGSLVAIDPTLPIAEQDALLSHALLLDPPAHTPSVTWGAQPSVTLPFTLRPHPMPTGRPWWVALIAVAIGVPLLLLRSRTPSTIAQVVIALTVAGMLVGVMLHWLYLNRRMLVVDELTVRRVNSFGRSHAISRAEIASLALPIITSIGSRVPDEPRLLMLDATGRCVLPLTRYWPTIDDAAQLAAALRVRLPADSSRPITASRLRRTIPGSVSWIEGHPYLASLVLLPPILVGAGLFIWALDGFK
jgi:hypothetical protein